MKLKRLLPESDSLIGRIRPQPGQVVSNPYAKAFTSLTEAETPQQLYNSYSALQQKVRDLEDKQKQLVKPFVNAKNNGDKIAATRALIALKDNQNELESQRIKLRTAETKYLKGIVDIDKNIELDPKAFE